MSPPPDSPPPRPAAPLFVVCDRCREEGLAGEEPFEAFGALLDFEPVPRRKTRADGWDAEVQRAFIAALSLTGSDRQAARAVGKAQFGVTQLLACPGSEGFAAAREDALAMADDERRRRLAEGVRAVAAEQAGWRPPPPPWSRASGRAATWARAAPPPPPEMSEEDELELRWRAFNKLVETYVMKLETERRCRLEGRIAEADFYLRQATFCEVIADLTSDGRLAEWLLEYRHGERDLPQVGRTPMSMLMDKLRRVHWEEEGAPPRPDPPPDYTLAEYRGVDIVRLYPPVGDPAADAAARRAAWEEQYAHEAEAQLAWEAHALADLEARRAAGLVPPPVAREPEPDAWDEFLAEAGGGAAEGDEKEGDVPE
jgi:hypothetical protein